MKPHDKTAHTKTVDCSLTRKKEQLDYQMHSCGSKQSRPNLVFGLSLNTRKDLFKVCNLARRKL